ncbi:MAG: hypothetical protein GXO88_13315 [Chlorobi bacterium]|nr:hypothetical protein [Chlorobiota bacterium]
MTGIIRLLPKTIMVLLVATILIGGATSCKSKKKLAKEKAAAEYALKVDQAKKDLTAIIDGSTSWTSAQMEERLAKIKSFNIDDEDVKSLIEQAEAKIEDVKAAEIRKAEEERLSREEEARRRAQQSEFAVVDNQFMAVASANGIDDANNKIRMALKYFETPDIPVLIIISQSGGFNDYDRPTTISKFLNYLKDKKDYKYRVVSAKRNSMDKITELELIVK